MTTSKFITKTIGAENVFTDVLQLDKGQLTAISIAGTLMASTVTLQRRFNAAGDWRDVSSYTAIQELGHVAECGMEVRLGVKASGYGGSDSIVIDMKVG